MTKKYYKYIIAFAVFCVLVILVLFWFIPNRQDAVIFAMIEKIDFSNTEEQVVEKINRLLEETKKESSSADNWGKLGMSLFIHGYKDISIPVFKKAATIDDKDFRWSYFCAIALNDLNSSDAVNWFERSRKLNPDYPPLIVMLGNRYLIDGDLQKAEQAFSQVIESAVRVPHANLGLAKILIKKGDLAAAQIQVQKAIDMAPKYREAHAIFGDIYRRMGEISSAEKEFQIMEQLPERLDLADSIYYQMVDEGVSSFWYQVRAEKYLKLGQLDKAEEEFSKALEAKPNVVSYASLGNVYQKQKRWDKALELYQQALQIDSNYSDALNNMGVVYFEKGNIDTAILIVKRSLRIKPESLDGYLNLGTFYKHTGHRLKAIECFQRGRELAPDDLRFAYQLAWLMAVSPEAKLRNGKESQNLAEMICDQTNYDATALDLLSVALAENGQYKKALDVSGRAYILAVFNKNYQLANDIKIRQKFYKSNQPYREK